MKLLVIDNYDSFTYNLVQLIAQYPYKIEYEVIFNDSIHLAEVAAFDKILLSPGAGLPSEAGIMPNLIQHYADKKSILGVCLGHQAIGEAFGATLKNLPKVRHGQMKTIEILSSSDYLFAQIPAKIQVGLYHSWAVSAEKLPETLEITALDEDTVMAIAHKKYDVRGIQFHPESFMTPEGRKILYNWLRN